MAEPSALVVSRATSKEERRLIRLAERLQSPDAPKLLFAGDELLWRGGKKGHGYGAALYRRLAEGFSVFHLAGDQLSEETVREDIRRVPAEVFFWSTARDDARACLSHDDWLDAFRNRVTSVHRALVAAGVARIVWVPGLDVDAPAELRQLNDAGAELLSSLGAEVAEIPAKVGKALLEEGEEWSERTELLLVDALVTKLAPAPSAEPVASLSLPTPKRATKIGDTPQWFRIDFDALEIHPASDEWIEETIDGYRAPWYRVSVINPRTGRMEARPLEAFGGRRYIENEIQKSFLRFTFEHGPTSAPRVLILGDSIRMRYSGDGYIRYVYSAIADRFRFLHLAHNVGSSLPLMLFRDSYLRNRPDVVLLNVGLHDVVRQAESPLEDLDEDRSAESQSKSEEAYRERLEYYARAVSAYGGQLVLMTTTPVIEQAHNSDQGTQSRRTDRGRAQNLRFNIDIDRRNEIVRSIADNRRLDVVDLHATISAELYENISRIDGVHLTRAGEIRAAQALVDHLRGLS